MAARKFTTFVFSLIALLAPLAHAATWTTSTNKCPNNINLILQLRDGRLLMAVGGDPNFGKWMTWTPDASGGYVNGTCRRVASMPDDYKPHSMGSAVANNGKVYIFGGEYNGNSGEVWTNQSAVYDPAADTWTMIPPPPGWLHIGDAPTLRLPNGNLLQLNCCTNEAAEFNTTTGQWENPSHTLLAHNNEVMTVLLQNNLVIMVDTQTNFYCGLSQMSTEVYDYATHTWACGPQTPMKLWDNSYSEAGIPAVTPNGELLWTGGSPDVTAVLNAAGTQWRTGPSSGPWHQSEGISTLLPDGTVLGAWHAADLPNCQYKVYDPSTGQLNDTVNPSLCPSHGDVPTFRQIILPTGQVILSDDYHFAEFYTPGTLPLQSVAPKVLFGALSIKAGQTYTIYGSQLTGVSCGSYKDDDAQMCTNYPLMQATDSQGNVSYWPTHDDSYSGITPGKISYTKFDVPVNAVPGLYTMRVITNGIPSNPVAVMVSGR